MYLYQIFFNKHKKKLIYFCVLGLFVGLINASLFMYINLIIRKIISTQIFDLRVNILFFLFLIWLSVLSKRYLSLVIIKFTQNVLYNIKSGLINLLLTSGYFDIKKKKSVIINILTRDVIQIAEAGNNITSVVTSIIMLLCCFFFMAFLSLKLFSIIIIGIVIGVFIYKLNMKNLGVGFDKIRHLNDSFLNYLNQIIFGFRELYLAKEKGIDLERNFITGNLNQYKNNSIKTYTGFLNTQYIGDILFYLIIGFMLFVANGVFNLNRENIVSIIFILLFIIGPIQNIVVLLPSLSESNISAKRLLDLTKEIRDTPSFAERSDPLPLKNMNFNVLNVKNIKFSFKADDGFEIGPISLTINKGEIIFIHGSNGSGKSSFIMCLLNIYKIDQGEILVDNVVIGENYSSLFAPVFSDFFLFDKFYGNRNYNKLKMEYYLKLFELESKVFMTDDGFSTIDLSMGQKKRLAIIQALLEDKEIIVLDEWAADQDPYFRRKFYVEILPLIKQEGKTIIAITHDDKYFSVADKLYKMESGNLIQQE